MRKILVTAALPYANGDIHLGYLVEVTQADIWVRFQKMRAHQCYYICADDTHGTPVMLRAEAEKITPEELIDKMKKAHEADLAGFNIGFDNYHSTHSDENRELSESMFRRLRDAGCIVEREIEQLYDPQKNMFLPDRYVLGNCPRCDSPDQSGDSCESCGAAYSPTELKNPRSALSGEKPIGKMSLHYFLHLSAMRDDLRQWTEEKIHNPNEPSQQIPRLQKEAVNKLREWLTGDLRDWDISRDAPYFGFRIPDVEAEKYFYVWLDAPIGYMASFKNLCDKRDLSFDDFWSKDNEDKTELYHFIGKDILYFHALFWPAMLSNSDYRRPTRVFAHGFLTVNGEKMSKSRGTFITARHYLDCGLNPEWIRYYYACKLNDKIEDIDLNLDDFERRINGDLVGKLVNIPSRVSGVINNLFGGCLDVIDAEQREKLSNYLCATQEIAEAYEARCYSATIKLILGIADEVNAYVDDQAPWALTKKGKIRTDEENAQLHRICSLALRASHFLMIYLRPVLPQLAQKAARFLKATDKMEWQDLKVDSLPDRHHIGKFEHLMKRVEKSKINTLIEKSEATADTQTTVAVDDGLIDIADFARMALRVAIVTKATAVAGADKLLHLTLDVGDGRVRSVFAGIKQHYEADTLIGRRVVYLSNLRPRKMRFGVSEGMVLAASDGEDVTLLSVADGISAGSKVN